jgi:UMF1 family MFS transporter
MTRGLPMVGACMIGPILCIPLPSPQRFFPIYYESVTTQEDGSTLVNFLGFSLPNTVLYSYALSFSFLFTALILPILTGIADYGGKKKTFLKIFVYVGGLACAGMYFYW